jgi:hypothetical protein
MCNIVKQNNKQLYCFSIAPPEVMQLFVSERVTCHIQQ